MSVPITGPSGYKRLPSLLESTIHVVYVYTGKILRHLVWHQEIEHFEELVLWIIFTAVASCINQDAERLVPKPACNLHRVGQ